MKRKTALAALCALFVALLAACGADVRAYAPAQAIPGGSLAANEGVEGAHTIDRHVGRTVEQLRQRLDAEKKREVSTFPDLPTAERAVARTLYERRAPIASWLLDRPRGLQSFSWTGDDVVGSVLRHGADAAVPGHTTLVVLAPTSKFAEGFRVHTAYVTTP